MDEPYHVQTRKDREAAKVKLEALRDALAPFSPVRTRLLERATDKKTMLRAWHSGRQAIGETVSCLPLPEGWRFVTSYPEPTRSYPADDVTDATSAAEAARWLAEIVAPEEVVS